MMGIVAEEDFLKNYKIKNSQFTYNLSFYPNQNNPTRKLVRYNQIPLGGCEANRESVHECEKLFNYYCRRLSPEEVASFFKYAVKSDYKTNIKKSNYLKDGTPRYQLLIFKKDDEKPITSFNLFKEEYLDALITFFVENRGLSFEENIALCDRKFNLKHRKTSRNPQNTLDTLFEAPKQDSKKEFISNMKDAIKVLENYDEEMESFKASTRKEIDSLKSERAYLVEELSTTTSHLKEAKKKITELKLTLIGKEYDEEKVLDYFKNPTCEFCHERMTLKTNEGTNSKRNQGVIFYGCDGFEWNHSTACRNTKSIDNKYIYKANQKEIDQYLQEDHTCKGKKYQGKVISRRLPLPKEYYR